MAHLLVEQLWFARRELRRVIDGLTEDDGRQRVGPLNAVSWAVGHLADQEQRYWVIRGQGRETLVELSDRVGSGRPASEPSLAGMVAAWELVTSAADPWLESLDDRDMAELPRGGGVVAETIGTMILRVVYHYFVHIGEVHAIRRLLGHRDLPEFVGAVPRYGSGAGEPEPQAID